MWKNTFITKENENLLEQECKDSLIHLICSPCDVCMQYGVQGAALRALRAKPEVCGQFVHLSEVKTFKNENM